MQMKAIGTEQAKAVRQSDLRRIGTKTTEEIKNDLVMRVICAKAAIQPTSIIQSYPS
jgi:hypothetical protein